jgi:hypothetical protein
MVPAPEAARMHILAVDFESRGLDPHTARTLSSELALRYPVSARLGLPDLAKRLASRGLEPDTALDAALSICTVEMLDRGVTFDAALSYLRRICDDPGSALAGALHGASLYRAISLCDAEDDELSPVTLIALGILSVVTLGFMAWVHLAL